MKVQLSIVITLLATCTSYSFVLWILVVIAPYDFA